MSFPYLAALSWRATVTEYASTKSFNTGQLGMTEDGSLWRLCKAGAAMTDCLRAKINYYEFADAVGGHAITPQIESAIAVGDTDFTITDATNARAADYYKGGYVIIPNAAEDGLRYIWKSSAEASDVYTIYVTAPFTSAYASGTIHVYPNPWGDVRNAGAFTARYEQWAGGIEFPAITSGYHFWIHVRGPHWFTVTGTWPGATTDDRDLVFHQDGTIKMRDESTNANQRAGYLMFSGTYGDVLTHLEIE